MAHSVQHPFNYRSLPVVLEQAPDVQAERGNFLLMTTVAAMATLLL